MTDEILARLQILRDSECIDTVVGIENIGCGPFSRGIFAHLIDLEKDCTVPPVSLERKWIKKKNEELTQYRGSIW
jgi:hypothetical protein